MLRLAARFVDDGQDTGERAFELFDESVDRDSSVRFSADLSSDEQQASSDRGDEAVRKAARLTEVARID
jgi:hypothetical protein